MKTPTLAQIIKPDTRGNIARFARAVRVSWPTAWRWCLPDDHPDYVSPPQKRWSAIEHYTGGRWKQPHGIGLARRPAASTRPRAVA